MKKSLLVLLLLVTCSFAFGQLSGTYYIPSGTPSYPTIAAAIADLNSQGIGGTGVTFLVAAGYTEASSAEILLTASGKSSGGVVFQKNGVGDNPRITRTDAGSLTTSTLGGQGDAVITIQGSDYVTFDGIDLRADLSGIEYGFYIRKASATDGCKNVTFRNSNITMNKGTSGYVVGIYASNNIPTSLVSSATGVTVTSIDGTNENITLNGNTISNVHVGIYARGWSSATYYDQNLTVGQMGAGNIVQNYAGGNASTACGIYLYYQSNANVSYNTFNNAEGGTSATSSLYGIYNYLGTGSVFKALNNTMNLTTGSTSSAIYGIYSSSTGDLYLESNNITLNSTGSTSGAFYYIYNASGSNSTLISIVSNTFNGSTIATTGTTYLIYNTGAQLTPGITNIQYNTVNGLINRTGGSGTFYCYYASSTTRTATEFISGNNFSNITLAGSSTFYGFRVAGNANATSLIYNNTISNITGGLGTMYGTDLTSANNREVNNNVFHAWTGMGTIYGISISAGNPAQIYKNRIYNLSSGAAGSLVDGIYVSAGSEINIYNNYISDLRAPDATGLNAIAGIYIGGGTNVNAYYNTIYLQAVSTGATFGTSGIFKSKTTTSDFRNNVIVNRSTPGATDGYTVALRWSAAFDPTYYNALSNSNCFYAGTPGPKNLIYYDGTTAHQTLSAYTAFVAPRDGNSFTELPPFMNIASTPYDLHMKLTSFTQCESGGTVIDPPPLAITDDFDGNPRFPNPGYPNNPSFPATAPDVGADEFGGKPNYTCQAPNPGDVIASANPICYGQSVTLSLQNAVSGTGYSYQWQSSTNGINYVSIPGATAATLTVTPEAPLYYICIVTCINGPITVYANPVQITFHNEITSTTPGNRCGLGTVQLGATSSGGTINWYATQQGGNIVGSGSPFTTPVINTSTTFYVSADDMTTGLITLGSGVSTSSSYQGPFYYLYGGMKSQYLIPASELIAAGLNAGNIYSLAFNITSATATFNDFTLSFGHTTLTALTSSMVTGLTDVFFTTGLTPSTGIFTITFTTPFLWDGTSNVVIQTCWSNNNSGSSANSSHVKYDATSYVATNYYRADNQPATVICSAATRTGSYSSRPQMAINGTIICSSPRVPVVATVTPPPALDITPGATVCNDVVVPLSVLSTLANFDTYTWSPVTNLFTDAACTIPYTALTNASTVYTRSAAQVTTTYTCLATNLTSNCVNSADVTVTFLPANPVINTTQESLCVSGSVDLTTTPSSGYGTATFQWQDSPDNVNFTDISGATDLNYTTPTLTSTTYYKLLIRNSAGVVCSSPQVTIVVNNPIITSTTPATRCGPGTVNLAATSNEGIITWFDAPSGGNALATGNNFTTPPITATTTYYVTASDGGFSTFVGKVGIETSAGTGGGLSTYMNFDAYSSFTLETVDLFPYGTGPGTVTIELRTSTGTPIMSTTVNVTGSNSTSSPAQRVTLNFPVPGGASYRLGVNAWTGGVSNLYRDNTGFSYPYTVPGVMSITGPSLSGYYYFFYNWGVSTGCSSPRVPVTATVTPGPALSVTADQTICANEAGMISVTTPLSNFDTYTWNPITNLFTDASCTIPYLAQTNLSTVYVKATDAMVTEYTCNANNTSTQCANFTTSVVTVLPASPTIVASPETICISGTANLTVSPTISYGTATFQWQTSSNNVNFVDIPGATSSTYTTPTISVTTYYRLIIKNGSGVICTQPQYTLQVINPAILTTTPGTRCGFGTVNLSATGSPGSVLNWYAAAAGGAVLGTGNNFTTPVITSTTPYYVTSSSGGFTTNVGMEASVNGTSGSGTSTYGLYFDALSSFTLKTVNVYPNSSANNTPGTVTISVIDETGVVLHQAVVDVIGYIQSSNPNMQTVTLNFNIQPANGLRLVMTAKSSSISGLMFQPSSQAPYPYPYTVPGVVSITSGTYGGVVRPTLYYYFYNWLVSTGCESPRTEVMAIVNPAPAVNATATPGTICQGQTTNLLATSGNAGYQYIWTPGDLQGPAQTVSPNSTTIFTVTAHDPVTDCNNNATIGVTVLPTPSEVTIDPPSANILQGTIQPLVASGGDLQVTGVFGTSATVNSTSGYPAPYTNYYGGTKHQMMILASELSGAGFTAGMAIATIQFNVTTIGSSFAGTLTDFQIDMGTTTATTLTSTSFIEGLTNVLPPALTPVIVGLNTHVLATPFVWDGTSNLVIQTSYSNGNTGTTSYAVQMTNSDPGFVSTNWYRADGVTPAAILAATTPTSSGNARPNMILGGALPTTMTWTPVTGLYLDPLATIAYAGTSTKTVYAKPVTSTVYTATANAPSTGCSRIQTAAVNVFQPPTVTTDAVTPSYYSAVGGGTVTSAGGGTILARGVCWSLNPNPTLADNFTTDGTGLGSFVSNLTPLLHNTPYHVRAYATNEATTSYGQDILFTTLNPCLPPTLLTATNITQTGADLNWTEAGAATSWDLEWGPAGFTQGSGTMVTGLTTKPYILTNLPTNSKYDFYVRSNCGMGVYTAWSGPRQFDLMPLPTISGTTEVCYGADPAIYFTQSGKTNYQWTVSAGGFVIFGGGATDDLIMILWTNAGAQTVSVNYQNSAGVAAPVPTVLPVTVFQPFVAGAIAADQTICAGTLPALLTGTAPTGGNVPYSYQWQESTDGTTFQDIAGATDLNYQPGSLTMTTYYRMKQTSYSNCGFVYTNVVTITMYGPLVAGTITPDQAICYREDPPDMLTGTAPTGGAAPYSYQWEISADGSNFTEISGATGLTYQPSVLTETTYYRMKQTSSGGCGFVYTNILTVVVYPSISAGSIAADQSVCYNTAPAPLTGTPPTGGNPPYSYQWAYSENGMMFIDIPGATNLNYSPGALTTSTYFIMTQTSSSGCGTVSTNMVTITVMPTFAAGSIAADQTIASGATPAPLTGVPPTGGLMPYGYQWQTSANGVNFVDIPGATNLGYAPGPLTVTTWYRARHTSAGNCGSGLTNIVKITVSNLPVNLTVQNVIVSDGQTFCYDALETITVAGSGTYFTVNNGGSATFIAGQKITYLPGTKVNPGGYMHGYISNEFCPVIPPAITNAQQTASPVVEMLKFRLYPNPTSGRFTVQQVGDQLADEVMVEVYTMLGERILTDRMNGVKKHEFVLPELPAGIYVVKIQAGDTIETVKLIRQ